MMQSIRTYINDVCRKEILIDRKKNSIKKESNSCVYEEYPLRRKLYNGKTLRSQSLYITQKQLNQLILKSKQHEMLSERINSESKETSTKDELQVKRVHRFFTLYTLFIYVAVIALMLSLSLAD